tara:strand:+ start:149786 stop:150067 length:282 start_codon:yes stop_codon:yes gene_type:complete
MSSIYQKLSQLRRAKSLSQLALANKLGIKQGRVSEVEAGKVDLQLSNVIKFADALEHEVMLVPKYFRSAVQAMVEGKSMDEPLWQINEEDDDE